jgi:multidrug efflux pump
MTSLAFVLGVVPLMVATGAGGEMRRTLGVAVFSGMLGVTLFGIFLTPVFFYSIDWLSETRFFSSPAVRRFGTMSLRVMTLGVPLAVKSLQRLGHKVRRYGIPTGRNGKLAPVAPELNGSKSNGAKDGPLVPHSTTAPVGNGEGKVPESPAKNGDGNSADAKTLSDGKNGNGSEARKVHDAAPSADLPVQPGDLGESV